MKLIKQENRFLKNSGNVLKGRSKSRATGPYYDGIPDCD